MVEELKQNDDTTRLSKRQTLSQPNVNWLMYVLIEQKWDENWYRLNARKNTNNVSEVGEQVFLVGTKEDINQQVWQEVIYVSPKEKDQIKAEEIAGKLELVYQRLKADLPYCREFYFQGHKYDKEGFEVLCEYIRVARSEIPMKILKTELEKIGLTCHDWSYTENSTGENTEENLKFLDWTYRFMLVSLEDSRTRQKLTWNTEVCADRINEIFERLHVNNKKNEPIDIMEDPETVRMLRDLTRAYGGSIIELFEKYLNPKVKKYWLTLIPPNNNSSHRDRYDLYWFRVTRN